MASDQPNTSELQSARRDIYKEKLHSPFLCMRFTCLKATKPLRGKGLLLTTASSGVPSTHLIDLARMKA